MRMTVGDLMSQGFVRVSPECSADEALNILDRHEATELYVTDKLGRLLGVLPDYEVIKTQLSGEAREATVEQLMSRGVPVFKPESDAAEVARLFRDARFGCLPVVSSGRLVGVITRRDIVRLMAVLRRIDAPVKTPATLKVKAPKIVSSRVRTKRGRPVAKSATRRPTRRTATIATRISPR
ncbi:MAG: CBS domain-containing protein [Candidatus Saccharimonas sp.]|nr:CBS domain-containing protein [Planctomycetaceae bacterium]